MLLSLFVVSGTCGSDDSLSLIAFLLFEGSALRRCRTGADLGCVSGTNANANANAKGGSEHISRSNTDLLVVESMLLLRSMEKLRLAGSIGVKLLDVIGLHAWRGVCVACVCRPEQTEIACCFVCGGVGAWWPVRCGGSDRSHPIDEQIWGSGQCSKNTSSSHRLKMVDLLRS